jgi:hypothetical protein
LKMPISSSGRSGSNLVEEGESWKVFGFDYTAAPRFGTLRVTQLVRNVAPGPVHR